ncbi:MAG: bifunctional 4-hydroxy-2-oxoglutarate aldolase/2-dehydro-3-deoxy-phosphogluconate aldolase [Pirellulaceae bacterium]|nr:bifunctional 4-hydroxy-2-oxoglutarate aldolase/2-dehydro-3-deoxy-phosphogluconate aldolase [Pirellulaceae bacterium]
MSVDKAGVVRHVLQSRVIAILRLDNLMFADQLVRVLLDGGVRAIELTLTNPAAPDVVASLLDNVVEFSDGRAVLGIGSVRSLPEARTALAAGAQFLVSPTCLEPVIRHCVECGVAVFPGALSPTEIAQADAWGADIVKLFPASAVGPDYVRDVLAPMPYLKLMPTGGISFENMGHYFDAGAVAVGIGGRLLNPQSIAQRDWPRVRLAAERLVEAARPAGGEI